MAPQIECLFPGQGFGPEQIVSFERPLAKIVGEGSQKERGQIVSAHIEAGGDYLGEACDCDGVWLGVTLYPIGLGGYLQ